MEKLIAQKEALEAKLADPKLYDGPADKVSALQIQLGEVVKQLDETEMAWLEASEAYEEAMAAGAEPGHARRKGGTLQPRDPAWNMMPSPFFRLALT